MRRLITTLFKDVPITFRGQAIIGMGNRLVHGYDAIDLDVLWDTIKVDLPQLIEELELTLE
jgi:uncharacterized protein with HEPN domain